MQYDFGIIVNKLDLPKKKVNIQTNTDLNLIKLQWGAHSSWTHLMSYQDR